MTDQKPSYEELAALVETLRAEIAELKEQLRAAHRQTAPFRRPDSQKKPSDQKKKPGRKKGHKGTFRQRPEQIDHKIDAPLNGCPCCGGKLADVSARTQYIEELPPVKPVVIELTTWQGTCAKCGPVSSSHPLQTSEAVGAAGNHLGPRAQALAIALSHQSGLSMRRSCGVLKSLCGLSLSPGGLAQLAQRASVRLNGYYEQILKKIRESAAVFADETSWYVGEPNWWLWVFTTPDTTLYRVEEGRGADVVLDTLTDKFPGMLVTDCLASYNSIECRKHKCIAHHLRALAEHEENLQKRQIQSSYLMLWKTLLKDVIATYNNRQNMSIEDYATKLLQISRGVANLLKQSPEHPEEVKFRDRLQKQSQHLLGCLSEPAAEPTNNRAERDLRPAVIDRKISCGNKTVAGKTAWEILRSVVVTASKRGPDPIDEILSHLRLHPT